MELPGDSTSTHELLRILGLLPSRLAFMQTALQDGIHIRWPDQAAVGITMDSPVIWLSMTQIGSVPFGRPGAGSMVVEAILFITESEGNHARATDR